MPIVRARDVRSNIRAHGFEQGVTITLEQFLDEFAEYRQHQRELVSMVDTCIDTLAKLNQINDAMKRQMDQMKRDREQPDGTQGDAV